MSISDVVRCRQQLPCYLKIVYIGTDDKVPGTTNPLVVSLEDNKNKDAFFLPN